MSLLPMPDLVTEIAFDSPDAASPTWVDVSDRVRANQTVTCTRGRSDERSDGNQPGTLTLTLDNADGWFTPGADSSPYYPNILPWRRIRVSLGSGDVVPLFYGFIQSWSLSWDAWSMPVVQVQASDSMALLGRRSLGSTYREAVLADSPLAFYPLDEPEGATSAIDVCGGPALGITGGTGGTAAFGADGTPVACEATGRGFDATSGWPPELGRTTVALGDIDPTIEAWVTTGATNVLIASLSGGDAYAALSIDGSGYARATSVVTGLPADIAIGTSIVNDGALHHLVASFGGTIRIFVDGVQQNTATGGSNSSLSPRFEILSAGVLAAMGGTFVGTISNVAVYDNPIGPSWVAAHYQAGLGFPGESTYDRINRWCSWVGVTCDLNGTDEGEPLGVIPTAGRTVLDAAADALRTDYGSTLLASLTGRAVTFTSRQGRYDATTSITLDCADDQLDGDLTVLMDPTYVASRVTVTTPDATHTSTNAATEATYGDIGMDVSVFPDSDLFAVSLAEGLGLLGATPTPRIPTVSTDLLVMARDTSYYDPTAIPECGDAMSLVNLPPTAPAAALDVFVEGLTESVSANEWRRTCSLSPGYPWLDVWTIEDDDLGYIEGTIPNVIAL